MYLSNHRFSKYHRKNLIDFCPEGLFRLGMLSHYLQLKLLSGKNVGAWVSMDFTQEKFSATIASEKIKILGAPWELPAKQHCQFGQFGPNLR